MAIPDCTADLEHWHASVNDREYEALGEAANAGIRWLEDVMAGGSPGPTLVELMNEKLNNLVKIRKEIGKDKYGR